MVAHRSQWESGARRLSEPRRWTRAWLCALGLSLALLVALATPTLAAPANRAGSPIATKIVLDETSIDGPGLWSLANGTVQGGFTVSGTPTYVCALAWTGADTYHHLNVRVSADGLHYTNKVILGETSNERPAVLAMTPSGPFVLAWTGTDPQHTLNLMYDVYGAKRKLILDEAATGAPSLAALGGKIYLAWTGTDANHSLNVLPVSVSSSGQFTLGAKTILGSYSSDFGPSIVGDPHNNGQLLLTWTYRRNASSAPSAINEAYSTDGAHWTTPLSAPPPQNSVAAPAILATSNQAVAAYYWAWSGTDALNSLNLIASNSIQSWPDAVATLTEQSADSPSLGYIGSGSNALLAWTGTDPNHHLNVATFSLSASGGPTGATCQSSQLSLVAAGSQGAAGHLGIQYKFTNTSMQTCTLYGYPNAQLLDANRSPVTTHVTDATQGYLFTQQTVQTVTLAPNGNAYFVINWSDVPNSSAPGCTQAAYLLVTPPGSSKTFTVPSSIHACSAGNLIISPVEPTSFGY